MGYARQILKALHYIEARLTDDLALQQVAATAGYSMYHFHRLFQALTGETPGGYIRKRRLVRAAEELATTDKRILDVALAYQFGSQEAFTRAFQSFMGKPPGKFRKSDLFTCPAISPSTIKMSLLHLRGGGTMKPEFVTLKKMYLIGMNYYGDNAQGEIPRLWGQFGRRMKGIPNKKGCCAYGLCIEPEDYEETGLFHYIAAVEVDNLEEIPMDMVGKVIPAGKFAVFTHKGPVSGLKDTYQRIFGTWVKENGLNVISGYDFELYDNRFTTVDDPKSEIDIYLALKS